MKIIYKNKEYDAPDYRGCTYNEANIHMKVHEADKLVIADYSMALWYSLNPYDVNRSEKKVDEQTACFLMKSVKEIKNNSTQFIWFLIPSSDWDIK